MPSRKEYVAQWYQDNKQHCALYYSDYRERVKFEMVSAYGGKCVECGEDDPIVLVLDHINDDGYLDRKIGLTGGFPLYRKLKREGWPKDRHQLLCHNCNFRKEYRRRKNAVRFKQAS